MNIKKLTILGLLLYLGNISVYGQLTIDQLSGKAYNPIRTAVPFLMIAPDSRSAGMGDAGVATAPDEASTYWNGAKLAFLKNDLGINVSYTPWLRQLVNDINLAYLSGHYRLDKNQVVGVALRYFALGNINFTDNSGAAIKEFNPNEFSIAGTYARKLSNVFAMSMSARYIHSNLTGSTPSNGEAMHPGNAFAFDLGTFYTKDINLFGNKSVMRYGLNLSNIGSKISYSESTKSFLPMNLRLGGSIDDEIDDYNKLSFTLEFNKLLAPTTQYELDENDKPVAVYDDNKSVATAIFGSFSDAPGINGMTPFKEELSEINTSIGLEYWYDKKLAFRIGYFHEPKEKGNRKYVTIGTSLRMNVLGLDIAYLIPTASNNPLAKTIRFSLLFNFDAVATN